MIPLEIEMMLRAIDLVDSMDRFSKKEREEIVWMIYNESMEKWNG